jgi:RNA polymerase sigma factor (sigma-70 family)
MTLPPFQAVLDMLGSDVHRFLIGSVGREDADDVYQETWLAALRAYPRLRAGSDLRAWVFTIAQRKAIDHVRRRRRQPVAVATGEELAAPVRAQAPDPELWSRVAALAPKQRTAIALRFGLDSGYPEIASIMGTSEAAARRSVHEGLKRLRKEHFDDRA